MGKLWLRFICKGLQLLDRILYLIFKKMRCIIRSYQNSRGIILKKVKILQCQNACVCVCVFWIKSDEVKNMILTSTATLGGISIVKIALRWWILVDSLVSLQLLIDVE